MILAVSDIPILLLSFDEVTEEVSDLAAGLSGNNPQLTEKEVLEKQLEIEKLKSSDVLKKPLRIPVPIVDALQMQQVSASSNTQKSVYYDNNNVTLANETNRVSVAIHLRGPVSRLSTSADLFYAIADKVFPRYTASPRVSFFGGSICFFNGYLTGINRTAVSNTDRETLNLTFERAPSNPEPETKEETGLQDAEPTPEPKLEDTTQEPEASARGVNTQATEESPGNAGGRLFYWYRLDDLETIDNRIISQFTGEKNINRLPFIIHKSENVDFSGVTRKLITVEYDGEFIPLGLFDHFPYYVNVDETTGYAVDVANDALYLGIEAV